MIIDFHTHVFPDRISEKALSKLSSSSGGVKPFYDGRVDTLKKHIIKSGADKAVALNIATNARQQKAVNDFAISLIGDDVIIPFGSVYPDSEDAIEELYRIKENGLKGIKLHPDYQHFFVDDKRMFKVYDTIRKLGLITVFHSGIDVGYPDPVHCTPERLSNVIDCFGTAPVVAAHFGGYLCWKETLKYLCGKNIFIDTSYAYSRMPPDYAKEIISAHPIDKFLFGSDMPWSDTADELVFVKSLGLSDGDVQKILGINAEKLLFSELF